MDPPRTPKPNRKKQEGNESSKTTKKRISKLILPDVDPGEGTSFSAQEQARAHSPRFCRHEGLDFQYKEHKSTKTRISPMQAEINSVPTRSSLMAAKKRKKGKSTKLDGPRVHFDIPDKFAEQRANWFRQPTTFDWRQMLGAQRISYFLYFNLLYTFCHSCIDYFDPQRWFPMNCFIFFMRAVQLRKNMNNVCGYVSMVLLSALEFYFQTHDVDSANFMLVCIIIVVLLIVTFLNDLLHN